MANYPSLMNLDRLKREFRHLSLPHKIVFIGCVSAIIFAFTPWFEVTTGIGTTERVDRMNGFSKYGIFGVISVVFATFSLFLLVRETFTRRDTFLSFNNAAIWMAMAGEAIFALTIGIFVFSELFNEFMYPKFRFGIFVSILSHILIFGGAHFSYQEVKKIAAKKSFKTLSDADLAKLNLQPEESDTSRDQLSFGDS